MCGREETFVLKIAFSKNGFDGFNFIFFVLMVAERVRYLSSLTSLGKAKGDSNTHGDFPFESLLVNIKCCLPNRLFHIITGSTSTRAGLLSYNSIGKSILLFFSPSTPTFWLNLLLLASISFWFTPLHFPFSATSNKLIY